MNNKLYISLGFQCLTSTVLNDNNLRTNSYPFDWILSNPEFIYKILYFLLEKDISIDKLVREHFFRNDKKCKLNRVEHYITTNNGKAIYNELYNCVFPHDVYNQGEINKYIRRFERLKSNILNIENNIKFIYISQSSLKSGNFTINGNEVINNVFENMNKIFLLIKKYNKNSKLIIFDAIQNEDMSILNNEIIMYQVNSCDSHGELRKEINNFCVNNQI
jgi:hypothetical protein